MSRPTPSQSNVQDKSSAVKNCAQQSALLTMEYLESLEPRLGTLKNRVAQIKDDPAQPYFCAAEAWIGAGQYEGRGIKPELSRLVGWHRVRAKYEEAGLLPDSDARRRDHDDLSYASMADLMDEFVAELEIINAHPLREPAENSILDTPEAYDLAGDHLLDMLPPCRDCGCLRLGA